ncbi:MAG: hypothetical protein ACFFDH_00595 [Promethearchaeota archaeon]
MQEKVKLTYNHLDGCKTAIEDIYNNNKSSNEVDFFVKIIRLKKQVTKYLEEFYEYKDVLLKEHCKLDQNGKRMSHFEKDENGKSISVWTLNNKNEYWEKVNKFLEKEILLDHIYVTVEQLKNVNLLPKNLDFFIVNEIFIICEEEHSNGTKQDEGNKEKD